MNNLYDLQIKFINIRILQTQSVLIMALNLICYNLLMEPIYPTHYKQNKERPSFQKMPQLMKWCHRIIITLHFICHFIGQQILIKLSIVSLLLIITIIALINNFILLFILLLVYLFLFILITTIIYTSCSSEGIASIQHYAINNLSGLLNKQKYDMAIDRFWVYYNVFDLPHQNFKQKIWRHRQNYRMIALLINKGRYFLAKQYIKVLVKDKMYIPDKSKHLDWLLDLIKLYEIQEQLVDNTSPRQSLKEICHIFKEMCLYIIKNKCTTTLYDLSCLNQHINFIFLSIKNHEIINFKNHSVLLPLQTTKQLDNYRKKNIKEREMLEYRKDNLKRQQEKLKKEKDEKQQLLKKQRENKIKIQKQLADKKQKERIQMAERQKKLIIQRRDIQILQKGNNVGLMNLGNTCYMNSALQAIHKTFQISLAINQLPSSKKNTQFIESYNNFNRALSKESGSFKPSKLKQLIEEYNPVFEGYDQKDSCQLLVTVINMLDQNLNRIQKSEIYKILEGQKSQQELYEQYVRKDHKRSYSIIDDILIGRYKTVYQCLQCHNKKILFQKYSVLYLPIPNNRENLTLKQCMKQFCKPQKFVGDNSWPCKKCLKDQPTEKFLDVFKANKIVIMCLKRFYNGKKIMKNIVYPQKISLEGITSQPKESNRIYELYGVICHLGSSIYSGHYICYCKIGSTWKLYNDSTVRQIRNEQQVHNKDALVLLYREIQ